MLVTDEFEQKAITGDRRAFGELIRLWNDDLRGVAWTITRSDSAADDVMQETYLKAFRSIGSFDGRSSLKTWMHSICYRTALDHMKFEARRHHDQIDTVHTAAVAAASHSAIARLEIESVLSDLNPAELAMLMLTAGLGYSFDEAAESSDRREGQWRPPLVEYGSA